MHMKKATFYMLAFSKGVLLYKEVAKELKLDCICRKNISHHIPDSSAVSNKHMHQMHPCKR